MAKPRRPRGRQRSATAEKTKTPQKCSAGPLEFGSQQLVTITGFVERILTLAGKLWRLYKLVSDAIEHFKDMML